MPGLGRFPQVLKSPRLDEDFVSQRELIRVNHRASFHLLGASESRRRIGIIFSGAACRRDAKRSGETRDILKRADLEIGAPIQNQKPGCGVSFLSYIGI